MKGNRNNPTRKKIVLITILGLAIGGLMLVTFCCTGDVTCEDIRNTKFCAIVKEFAPASVQAALEYCQTELTICEGEQVVLFWRADSKHTDSVHISGPGGLSYDFPLAEGYATVTPTVSGEWKITFIGDCRFYEFIQIEVIRGPTPKTIIATGNIDIGFTCNIHPNSVDPDLVVLSIRAGHCEDIEGFFWENWSCTKSDWDGSNQIFFNITTEEGSANLTQFAGRWHFYPTDVGGFSSNNATACFPVTVECKNSDDIPTDIYPTPTPTPWPNRNP